MKEDWNKGQESSENLGTKKDSELFGVFVYEKGRLSFQQEKRVMFG